MNFRSLKAPSHGLDLLCAVFVELLPEQTFFGFHFIHHLLQLGFINIHLGRPVAILGIFLDRFNQDLDLKLEERN